MAKKKYREPREEFVPEREERSVEVQEALDVAAEIVRLIEEDIPDRAKNRNAEYFESCGEKADSIAATVGESNRVSDAQRSALDNIIGGLRKWVHDD